ncbi:MAG: AAA family ATPase [Planctomycetes bacterium]|nr:AAA family ATPase [Planctomycetota bacterium]
MNTGESPHPSADAAKGKPTGRASTGIAGLDEILQGGLPRNRVYLIQGDPGTGKTTLALQFLLEGVALGEKCVYLALSETRDELVEVVRSHGWSLEGIDVQELTASQQMMQAQAQQTVFEPAEVELHETTRKLLDIVGRSEPSRVVLDSLSELRLLGGSSLRFRQQILAIKQYFAERRCTVLLIDDLTVLADDRQLQSLTHGVIQLEQLALEYGADRRRLRVVKIRGMVYRQGYHDYTIQRGGLHVFPRLVAAEHRKDVPFEQVSSGIAELDNLVGGGPLSGTSILIVGPSGVGKSTVSLQYAMQAARQDKHVAIYLFDERPVSYVERAKGMAMDPSPYSNDGHIVIQQIDPAELSAGQFTHMIRDQVEGSGFRMVLIDSLDGFRLSMLGEKFLVLQLHELLAYLGQSDVSTVLTMSQHGILPTASLATEAEVSYLADTIMLLRYYEYAGEVRRAISCVKKRSGAHEHTIRAMSMTPQGLKIGEPLRNLRGVLTGMPVPIAEASRAAGGEAGLHVGAEYGRPDAE